MDTTCRCDRRTVLHHAAVGAAGASALALSACGGSDSGSGADSSGAESDAAAGTWRTAVEADSLPEVGTTVSASAGESDLLVHRSAEDEVLVYSSVCTHQGCTVGPGDEEFTCPCHNSTFAAADGSVISGPAQSPLPTVEARMSDDGAVEVKV